eukprot:4809524-Prorocentrum_lima.AAC.1
MTSSLVGSEMCIRDRPCVEGLLPAVRTSISSSSMECPGPSCPARRNGDCLLYTSDAADDM